MGGSVPLQGRIASVLRQQVRGGYFGEKEEDALRAGTPHLDLSKEIWESRHCIQEPRWIKAHLTWEEATTKGWDMGITERQFRSG